MSKEKENDDCQSIVWSPFVGVSFLATCFLYGFGWVPYAIVMLLLSNIIGYYTEAKINELDRITREKAKAATGNEQPGDASGLGELVRKTNQVLGVFCPAIPIVSLCCGWWMSYKAHKLARVGAAEAEECGSVVVPSMFASEGRCVF